MVLIYHGAYLLMSFALDSTFLVLVETNIALCIHGVLPVSYNRTDSSTPVLVSSGRWMVCPTFTSCMLGNLANETRKGDSQSRKGVATPVPCRCAVPVWSRRGRWKSQYTDSDPPNTKSHALQQPCPGPCCCSVVKPGRFGVPESFVVGDLHRLGHVRGWKNLSALRTRRTGL